MLFQYWNTLSHYPNLYDDFRYHLLEEDFRMCSQDVAQLKARKDVSNH